MELLSRSRLLAPPHRLAVNVLVVFTVFALLLFMATGVLRLSLNLAWTDSAAVVGTSHALIDVRFDIDNLFAPLLRNSGFDARFWVLQSILFAFCLALSFFRSILASFSALCTWALVYLVSHNSADSNAFQDLLYEYGMIAVITLYCVHVLLTFFGEMRDKYVLMRLFSEFVPPELVRQYSSDPQSVQLVGDAREVSVLFCDVRGFTSISERLSPSLLAQWLNMYFDAVSEVIVRHNGTIDKYIGDSVMAIWGAPISEPRHADKAIAAAIDALKAIERLNVRLRKQHLPEIAISIGVSSGFCNAGILGSRFRRSYTVVGDTVNIAQRLETLTRKYNINLLVSDTTRLKCQDTWLYRELSTEAVKGRKRFVHLNQPVCLAREADEQVLQHVQLHNHCMRLLDKRQWYQAQAVLEYLKKNAGEAGLYAVLIEKLAQRRNKGVKRSLARSSATGQLAHVYQSQQLAKVLNRPRQNPPLFDQTPDD